MLFTTSKRCSIIYSDVASLSKYIVELPINKSGRTQMQNKQHILKVALVRASIITISAITVALAAADLLFLSLLSLFIGQPAYSSQMTTTGDQSLSSLLKNFLKPKKMLVGTTTIYNLE